jgi:hypothetical protein
MGSSLSTVVSDDLRIWKCLIGPLFYSSSCLCFSEPKECIKLVGTTQLYFYKLCLYFIQNAYEEHADEGEISGRRR